jgi:hypothetical protein
MCLALPHGISHCPFRLFRQTCRAIADSTAKRNVLSEREDSNLRLVGPTWILAGLIAERRRSVPKASGTEKSPRHAPRAFSYTTAVSLSTDLDTVSRGNATTAVAGNAG